ncbi:CoA transferase [Adhaeribacter sp. BT258]|uniref:CoA transferase n=1 Tax=Adhaeribacter terrigena TaxID=2793070 RepID=A0ABS1C5F3_9BACT|nr:CaiB/BaiF CoA-transferase family protein [Adhaeribacter terrigena]MBK0404620.1 CoA transferase [Adhaeribacter terrigena]
MLTEQPFSGLVVLELASVLAGPSVGQFFAELGATVIKIENTGTRGDVTRQWKARTEDPETDISAYFSCANWGKRSVALDLKKPAALQILHKLVAQADIVVASYKPGDAEKLQVDYKTLSEINPKLLYGHITGYGPENPRAGYDAVIQAESGIMYLNGEPDGLPTKMPVAFVDLFAAHQLKEGLLTALYLREKTGKGQLVQISLLDAALTSLANQGTNYLVAGFEPERAGSEHPNIVPYGTIFTTSDQKQLILAIGDDRQFRNLCLILSAPEIAEDALFSKNSARVKNRLVLNQKLKMLIAGFTLEYLLTEFEKRFVPAGAVRSVSEALSGEAAKALQLRTEQAEKALSGLKTVAFRLSKVGNEVLLPPPHYAEHTREVLLEFAGMDHEGLQNLQAAGIIQ